MTDRHVSPKIHRDPPAHPQQALIDDGYLVEPEPVEPRQPYHGWESVRERWARADRTPAPHGCAWFGLAFCAGFLAAAILLTFVATLDATPRSAALPTSSSPALDVRLGSAGPSTPATATSGAPLNGAPPPLGSQSSDGRRWSEHAAEGHGAPQPTGEVGTALIGGWATWYDDGDGLYAAAGPELRAAFGPGWRGTVVDVAGPGGLVVRVPLTDACACGDRHGLPTLLDMSADAFGELAPLSWGLVAVSIELVPALPRTDMEEDR